MDYWGLISKLASSSVATVGLLAVILPLFDGDAFFLGILVLLVALNLILILAIKNFSTRFFSMTEYARFAQKRSARNQPPGMPAGGNIGLALAPLEYPQVHDDESRSYVPEFIRMDLFGDNGVLFQGNLSREVLKQFRNAIDQALSAKPSAPAVQNAKPKAKKD